MMEEKIKLVEKIVNQLHQGNFNPCIKSELPTPDESEHPLEMSCIPHIGSPVQPTGRLVTGSREHLFMDTPELVCASMYLSILIHQFPQNIVFFLHMANFAS